MGIPSILLVQEYFHFIYFLKFGLSFVYYFIISAAVSLISKHLVKHYYCMKGKSVVFHLHTELSWHVSGPLPSVVYIIWTSPGNKYFLNVFWEAIYYIMCFRRVCILVRKKIMKGFILNLNYANSPYKFSLICKIIERDSLFQFPDWKIEIQGC